MCEVVAQSIVPSIKAFSETTIRLMKISKAEGYQDKTKPHFWTVENFSNLPARPGGLQIVGKEGMMLKFRLPAIYCSLCCLVL